MLLKHVVCRIRVVTNPFIKMLPNISGLNNELGSDLAPESGRCVVCTCDKRAVSQSARRACADALSTLRACVI